MITIDFSQRGNESLTDFLYIQLKNKILEGSLPSNQKLPSKRSLASHLGVSVITVQNAYQQLIDEGYVYSEEKRGYFVTELEAFSTEEPTKNHHFGSIPTENQKNSLFDKEIFQNHNSTSEIISAVSEKNTINLQAAHIHQELFPFSQWASLMRKVLHESKERILSPLPPQGLLELRQAIASYLGTFRNMKVQPEQVVIGAGTEYLYSLTFQLLGKQLQYGLENPGYQKPAQIMAAMGVGWTPLTMDNSGIMIQELEEKHIDAVLVSPAHHFPTGIIMPIKRRQELLAWARQGTRFILEDDYDSEFRFTGRPLETLFSLDATSDSQGQVIYLNTFTKTLTPSLRISYMVLPWHLVQKFYQQLGFYSCTVSSIEQLTLARFIQEGHYEKHLSRKKNHYRNVRDNLLFHLSSSPMAERFTISGKDSGLHFLLKIQTNQQEEQLKKKLEAAGIQVAFLSQYHHFSEGNQDDATNTLVINYSALKKEQIPQLVSRLSQAL